MTVTPASISSADYYAKDDYYAGEFAEGVGEWGGKGAVQLGLSGPVEAEAFSKVLDGVLPNGEIVGRAADGTRSKGFDLTFSAPKSVSIIGLVARDERVIDAHRAAVASIIGWAEERYATAREGKGGAVKVSTGNLVHASFHHELSRAVDPQLHTHVAVANLTRRPDGAWRALHNEQFWKNSSLLGAAYHAELRANLARLGYETVITGKHGAFEIKGVSQTAIDAFSRRREDILDKAAELGASSPKALEAIALRTRDAKTAHNALEVRTAWADRSKPFAPELSRIVALARDRTRPAGLLATVRAWGEALLARVTNAFGPKPEPLLTGAQTMRKGEALAAAYSVAAGARHVSERAASFTRSDLVRASLQFAENGATVRGIEGRIDRLVEAGEMIAGKVRGSGSELLTTRDLRATEIALVKAARDGAGQGAAILIEPQVSDALAKLETARDVSLSAEQRRAAMALLAGRNAVQLVQGHAGAGKSTLFALVNEIANGAGRDVIFLTTQNLLVSRMREEGLDAHSIASVLSPHAGKPVGGKITDHDRALFQDKLVVIEEASMLTTRQFASLFEIASRAGAARIALVGDDRQIEGVGAGRVFALLQEHHAPTERLTENRRQLDPDLAAAVRYARDGDVRGAFDALGGRVSQAVDPVKAAAERYLGLAADVRDRTSIFTSGHVLREAVLDHVRDAMIARGDLSQHAIVLPTLDTLNLTRTELRQIANWSEGMRLEVFRMQAGLRPGSYDVGVVARDDHAVELHRDGRTVLFDPASLSANGEGASLAVPGTMEVREGDRLLFAATDRELGVVNGTRVTCGAITDQTVSLTDGERNIVLEPGDPMRERLGHAAVLNMHRAQGLTVDRAITVMHSENARLNSQSLHYVLLSRAREDLTLVTDDRESLIRSIEDHPGSPAHAADLAPELARKDGERFDPRTGELLEDRNNADPSPANTFDKEMAKHFAEPEKASRSAEPEFEKKDRELELERDRDYEQDFDMEM